MEVATFETDLEEIFPAEFSNPSLCMKILKKVDPKLYQKFFSKIYHGTDKFGDWRRAHLVSASHVMAASHPRGKLYYEGVQAGTNALQHALRWYKAGLPCFFISRQFYDAVRRTDVPPDFDFSQMEWPYESFTFILPRGVLYYKNLEVPSIGVSVCRENVVTDIGSVRGSKSWNKLIVTTSFGKSYFAPAFHMDHLSKFYAMDDETFRETADHAEMCEGQFEVNDSAFTLLLLKLALKLTMVMEAAPEHVERGHRIGTTKKRDIKREIWSPNIIGRKYQVKYTDRGTGTHASPRMHTRRGHIRQQGVGHRNTDCYCTHLRLVHYQAPYERFDPPTEIEFCQVANCPCERYQAPLKPYAEYKTVWIKPMLVAAQIENTKGE